MLFDPVKDPLIFLVAALGLGFLQVWFGVFIKVISDIQNKLWQSAIFKEMPALSIQTCVLFLILSYIKILPGDKVTVQVSTYDLTKGRITYRHSGKKS